MICCGSFLFLGVVELGSAVSPDPEVREESCTAGSQSDTSDSEGWCTDSKSNSKIEIESPSKIAQLEERIKELESRSPKKYPDVKFLTYQDRKRILVRMSFV